MEELAALHIDRKEVVELIKKADRLKELKEFPLFKELILDDYIESNATRLVDLLANIGEEHKPAVVSELEAISRLKSYIKLIEMMGQQGTHKLEEIDNAISEIQSNSGKVEEYYV